MWFSKGFAGTICHEEDKEEEEEVGDVGEERGVEVKEGEGKESRSSKARRLDENDSEKESESESEGECKRSSDGRFWMSTGGVVVDDDLTEDLSVGEDEGDEEEGEEEEVAKED